MDSLDDVARAVRACTDCPLHRSRTNAVPGEGNPSAELMFIGEGPGFHEDRQGRPFVGPAGQLLEGLLASIGTNRDNVFIANMVKCRPPENRDPQPPEIAACAKFLERQIELVNPKLIVTLGRFSLGRFFPGESVTRARGSLRQKDERLIFPVLHPAAALRRPELRATMVEDFRAIAAALADAPEPEPAGAASGSRQEAAEAAAQMDLFGSPAPAPAVTAPDSGPPEEAADRMTEEDAPGPQQLSMF
jgi:uracil-DNA glycosylase family 4